jgi:hypothetical protein
MATPKYYKISSDIASDEKKLIDKIMNKVRFTIAYLSIFL